MKPLLALCFIILLFSTAEIFHRLTYHPNTVPVSVLKEELKKKEDNNRFLLRLQNKASFAKQFVAQKGFSNRYVFLIDMRLPSGKKRFFIYDLQKDSIIHAGLVAHGSCNKRFLEAAQFSNEPQCGCSADGKYKVGEIYKGRFGKAFKLYGLDNTNNNAYQRYIVLHAYSCVPDEEVYPRPICNSLGCPMVSYQFLAMLTTIIEETEKPILLWIYN